VAGTKVTGLSKTLNVLPEGMNETVTPPALRFNRKKKDVKTLKRAYI